MQIAKYTSIKSVLERVYSDTGFNYEIPHEDLILWTVEVMDLIGYPLSYVPKIMGYKMDSAYDFTEYRVPIPCDFHSLSAITVNGVPAIPASDSFHNLMDGNCCGITSVPAEVQDLFYSNFTDVVYSPQAGTINYQATVGSLPLVTFSMNDSWITFNVKEGKVCMAYMAFPIDEDGFPLIPDDTKYKRAVTNYLIHKVDYILWRRGIISDKVFQKSEMEYTWAIGSATSHLKVPDVHQMELIKRSIIRLIPKFDSYNSFFADLASKNYRI
jgi:hypothetical protein